jgi:hypothetical protein
MVFDGILSTLQIPGHFLDAPALMVEFIKAMIIGRRPALHGAWILLAELSHHGRFPVPSSDTLESLVHDFSLFLRHLTDDASFLFARSMFRSSWQFTNRITLSNAATKHRDSPT